jgi:hypothetical protein
MSETLYEDVQPGDKITAELFNRLQDQARRKDRFRFGSSVISTQGHIDTDAVDIPEAILVRANQDILPGADNSNVLNATLLGWDYTARRPVDGVENYTVRVNTYLLPLRKNDVFLVYFSEVASAYVPAITDYCADLMVDTATSIAHIFGGHIQLPNNNAFIDPFNDAPPTFAHGPDVWIMPTSPTGDPSIGDEMIGHYTGLYKVEGVVRPLFRFTPSGGGGGGGPPTVQSVPLRVTSSSPVSGLWPAVIENFDPTPAFTDSTTLIWAVTTNLNGLALSKYTGIHVGYGGSPPRDIYCVSDNMTIDRSDGSQGQTGINHTSFSPPYDWNIAAGAQGQAIVQRLLTVQDELGLPPVQLVYKEEFAPYYTWDISILDLGYVQISRLFEVWQGGAPVQEDVYRERFIPSCAWDIQPDGQGVCTIRRLFTVNSLADIAKITFDATVFSVTAGSSCEAFVTATGLTLATFKDGVLVQRPVKELNFYPACTWDITDQGNFRTGIRRIFNVLTDTDVILDVTGIGFTPNCAWDVQPVQSSCDVVVKRLLTVHDNDNHVSVDDVADIEFSPSFTWQLTAGSGCQIDVRRKFDVVGSPDSASDIWQITFAPADFVTSAGGAGQIAVNTRGLTISICYCDIDGVPHQLNFQDGLLQSVQSTPTSCHTY